MCQESLEEVRSKYGKHLIIDYKIAVQKYMIITQVEKTFILNQFFITCRITTWFILHTKVILSSHLLRISAMTTFITMKLAAPAASMMAFPSGWFVFDSTPAAKLRISASVHWLAHKSLMTGIWFVNKKVLEIIFTLTSINIRFTEKKP